MRAAVLIPPSKYAKNVARDLIYGCWCKGKRIAGLQFPPVSQLLVATVLREDSVDAFLIDAAAERLTIRQTKDRLKGCEAIILLTSSVTIQEDADILAELKKDVEVRPLVIVYGAQATFMPRQTLGREAIDIVVRREPEYIIRDLLRAIRDGADWRLVKGIGYRDKDEVILNDYYPFIEDMDELPVPDRKALNKKIEYFNPVVKRMPYTTMFTSRGCPGKCTFCSSPPFYGRKIRYRSSGSVLNELGEIVELGYREVFFRDENFTVKKSRTKEICEGIISRGYDLSWICSSRIDNIDRESMVAMKNAGCHMIRLGVESGVQEILDKSCKGTTLEQIREIFRWTHEIGLDTHAHLMLGMPGETEDTIRRTIDFVLEIEPTIVTFGICTPYPGTQLFEQVLEKRPEIGDGSGADLGGLHTVAFHNDLFTDMRADDLSNWVKRAYRRFYLRPKYWMGWIKRVRSWNEFKRVSRAGMKVVDFAFRGDEMKPRG